MFPSKLGIDSDVITATAVPVEAVAIDQYAKQMAAAEQETVGIDQHRRGSSPSKQMATAGQERSREWPKALQKAVVNSFKRKPDAIQGRKFLSSCNWPSGLIEAFLLNVEKVPMRFFIVDDSGSMNTNDGLKLVGKEGAADDKVIKCTRWSELSTTVEFHARLAEASKCPTEFRLLNGSDPVVVGLDDDGGEGLNFFLNVMEDDPAGQTPLCEHIEDVVNAIRSLEGDLRRNGQKAIVVIATDGEASDGDVTAALKPLEKLPVLLVLRLCTDDENVTKYWNDVDKQLELEVDVLDDLCAEASGVSKANPWLTYTDSFHKMREFGASIKEMDLIDESRLSSEQMRVIVAALLFDGKKKSVPHPDEDWGRFATSIKKALKDHKRQQSFDINTGKLRPLIDMKELKDAYGSSGKDASAVCTIS